VRRKEMEIKDPKILESILRRAAVCRLGLSENNTPYVVPLNFGYRANCLYFHSAREGRKINIIHKNNRVCFEVEFEAELIQAEKACDWGMKYISLIGFGKAYLVENSEEKREALNIILEHYSGRRSFDYSEKDLKRVVIIKVKIGSMTGKKS
jgi:nitroimidazol reductase NimA-like FMN-containing flavoprotein (pyridoxamine 5'-phosphate oxidase superfamily)